MAGRKAAKQAPAKIEDDDDAEGWEDAVVETETEKEADLRMRDWRDVERYREMKELRRLVDDDYGLEEIFRVPVRLRAEPGNPGRGSKAAKDAAKAAKPGARPAAKAIVAKAPAKSLPAAAKPHKKPPEKPAPAAARARSPGLKAKAKRR